MAFRSDLEIPQPLPRLFSLYLLMAIGFKGGVELSHSAWDFEVFATLGASLVMAFATPVWVFFLLRRKLGVYDAAALAATYGSISAVTFITAGAYLDSQSVPYGGHMVASMALMESPAIIMGVLLVRMHAKQQEGSVEWGMLIREAFTNASVFLILGSMCIGLLTGEVGKSRVEPFLYDIFTGMLAFFLLDMGLVAAKRVRALRSAGLGVVVLGVVLPLVHALLAVLLSVAFNFTYGDAFLFVVLCASASYIAVPAAVRIAIPEANPGLYVPMSLAVTFPFNILVGLPLYDAMLRYALHL